MPHIDLPPESLPTDPEPSRAPFSARPNVVTPEAVTPEPWQQRVSSPVGFVPVLATELIAEGARPTLHSPEAAKKLPKRTVPMSHASHARAASQSALAPRATPLPVLPTETDVEPPMRAKRPERQEPVANVSGARGANAIGNDEPQSTPAYLWAHRLSFGAGLLFAITLFAIWLGAVRPVLRARVSRASDSASAAPKDAAQPPGPVQSAVTPLGSTSAEPSQVVPNASASARVSPAGSARSFPRGPLPGQSHSSRPPGLFAPHAL